MGIDPYQGNLPHFLIERRGDCEAGRIRDVGQWRSGIARTLPQGYLYPIGQMSHSQTIFGDRQTDPACTERAMLDLSGEGESNAPDISRGDHATCRARRLEQ
jgi:hypothetical protein